MIIDVKNNPREIKFKDLNKGEAFYGDDGKLCMKIDAIEKYGGFINAVLLENGITFYLGADSIIEKANVKIVRL